MVRSGYCYSSTQVQYGSLSSLTLHLTAICFLVSIFVISGCGPSEDSKRVKPNGILRSDLQSKLRPPTDKELEKQRRMTEKKIPKDSTPKPDVPPDVETPPRAEPKVPSVPISPVPTQVTCKGNEDKVVIGGKEKCVAKTVAAGQPQPAPPPAATPPRTAAPAPAGTPPRTAAPAAPSVATPEFKDKLDLIKNNYTLKQKDVSCLETSSSTAKTYAMDSKKLEFPEDIEITQTSVVIKDRTEHQCKNYHTYKAALVGNDLSLELEKTESFLDDKATACQDPSSKEVPEKKLLLKIEINEKEKKARISGWVGKQCKKFDPNFSGKESHLYDLTPAPAAAPAPSGSAAVPPQGAASPQGTPATTLTTPTDKPTPNSFQFSSILGIYLLKSVLCPPTHDPSASGQSKETPAGGASRTGVASSSAAVAKTMGPDPPSNTPPQSITIDHENGFPEELALNKDSLQFRQLSKDNCDTVLKFDFTFQEASSSMNITKGSLKNVSAENGTDPCTPSRPNPQLTEASLSDANINFLYDNNLKTLTLQNFPFGNCKIINPQFNGLETRIYEFKEKLPTESQSTRPGSPAAAGSNRGSNHRGDIFEE